MPRNASCKTDSAAGSMQKGLYLHSGRFLGRAHEKRLPPQSLDVYFGTFSNLLDYSKAKRPPTPWDFMELLVAYPGLAPKILCQFQFLKLCCSMVCYCITLQHHKKNRWSKPIMPSFFQPPKGDIMNQGAWRPFRRYPWVVSLSPMQWPPMPHHWSR